MKTPSSIPPASVEEYISKFPEPVQEKLSLIRSEIMKAAPMAEELISYRMPAYKYKGVLVYFAGYRNHIGFYATPTGHTQFKKDLSKYKTGRGSVQFPLSEPLPLALISKMVAFKVRENEDKFRVGKIQAKNKKPQ
ncbi:MAG: DUF1801 domain-containing protein [Bacteroidota bacterium]|nr:DUF1801 domain-containing protein [Bacteroidota bacterium]